MKLIDGRTIECDVKREGSDVLLIKRAGTITVPYANVVKIETITMPTTSQPTTQPSLDPSKPNGF